MKSIAFTFRFALVLAVTVVPAVAAPRNAESESESDRLVKQALGADPSGIREQRREILQRAIAADPANPAARWQTGQVQQDGKWIDYETFARRLLEDREVNEYRIERSKHALTRQGQIELANWCRDRKLPQQERAHLTAALALSDNPDEPVLRTRLGYQQVDGMWMLKSELAEQQEIRRAEQEAFRDWQARVRLLVKKLDARQKSVRDEAMAELKQLQNPDIIPVLEVVLLNAGLERERLLVELLSGIPSHKAADALARVAVLSGWDIVRKEAATELRRRPIETYSPELLRSLRTSIDSRISLYVGSGGVHLLRSHVSETQHTREVVQAQASVVFRPVILRNSTSARGAAPMQARAPTARERTRNRSNRTVAAAVLEAELKAYAAERAAKYQNEMIEQWNQRVCSVLREGTGFTQLNDDPQMWWKWWCDYNQMEEEEKETVTQKYYERKSQMIEMERPPCECLVAGTPIWTDRGFVAVEEMQVGDLVLAQNPESGELSYRPVLRTTIREEQPVLEVTTASGILRGTGGHTFWVLGRGWSKLLEVKPGERFHSVEGPVEILSLERTGQAKTYNLVVADDHTYFVGRPRILSHDVTFAEPVDAVVPGLEVDWGAPVR